MEHQSWTGEREGVTKYENFVDIIYELPLMRVSSEPAGVCGERGQPRGARHAPCREGA